MRQAYKQSQWPIIQASALYAASQSAVFLVAALGFWYGGTLISHDEYTIFQYFVCFAALISGSQSVGAIFSFAPDMGRAKQAGQDIKRLLDTSPTIHLADEASQRIQNCKGDLALRNVYFSKDQTKQRGSSRFASCEEPMGSRSVDSNIG